MPSETLKQLCERSATLRGWEDEVERVIARSPDTIAQAFVDVCLGGNAPTIELAEHKRELMKLIMYLTQIAMSLEHKHEARISTGK